MSLLLQIRFWKVNDDSKIRTEDVVINKWEPCWPYDDTRSSRTARSAPEFVEATVFSLWPFSTITAGVVVVNGAKSGSLSPTVTFRTPEGGCKISDQSVSYSMGPFVAIHLILFFSGLLHGQVFKKQWRLERSLLKHFFTTSKDQTVSLTSGGVSILPTLQIKNHQGCLYCGC